MMQTENGNLLLFEIIETNVFNIALIALIFMPVLVTG